MSADQGGSDYQRMKRLYWEPSYVPKEAISPPMVSEGIHFPDWDNWDDPFNINFRQYIEIQDKKEQGFHPARDAFERYGGADRTDARWKEGMKILYPYLCVGEYGANRGHARVSRYAPAPAQRAASFYQSLDEIRHTQNHIYQIRSLNQTEGGLHNWANYINGHFLFRPIRLAFEDMVASDNVFEAIVALNFCVEVAYTNLVFVGVPSQGVLNGDTAFAGEMLTTQSDETRHMAIGQSVVRTLLEADERNLEPLQYWFDKWFWLQHRAIATPTAVFPDYFARKKSLPFNQMHKRYVVNNFVDGLVDDLGKFGFQRPRFLEDVQNEVEDMSHSLWRGLYQYKNMLFTKMFAPDERDLDFFSEHYPHFEERHGKFWREVADGDPKDLASLPMLCQVCQIPCVFPTPENPSIQSTVYEGHVFWFCSPACQWIFEHEPVRYSRAVTLDRVLTGMDVPEIRAAMHLPDGVGGVLEEVA